jgi:hypothetical protein
METTYTITDLHSRLASFEQELKEAGKSPNTIKTYVDRSERFLKWLANDYDPFAQ